LEPAHLTAATKPIKCWTIYTAFPLQGHMIRGASQELNHTSCFLVQYSQLAHFSKAIQPTSQLNPDQNIPPNQSYIKPLWSLYFTSLPTIMVLAL